MRYMQVQKLLKRGALWGFAIRMGYLKNTAEGTAFAIPSALMLE